MSDNASQNKQKEIIDFLKRYIKSTLHSVTWDIEGEQVRNIYIYIYITDIHIVNVVIKR
jgi:hypothetical protein